MSISDLIGNWFDTESKQDLEISYTYSFSMEPSIHTFTFTNEDGTKEIHKNVILGDYGDLIGVTNWTKYSDVKSKLFLGKIENGYVLFIQQPPFMKDEIITTFLKKK